MPIIHLANPSTDRDKPNFRGYHYGAGGLSSGYDEKTRTFLYEGQGPRAYWTYESHHGLCLYDREVNGYHDSDWYMMIWNPETKKPEQYFFATTRGWSYPCYASSPDATPEVRAEYEEYLTKKEHHRRIMSERARRNAVWKSMKDAGLNRDEYERLRIAYTGSSKNFDKVLNHLKKKRLRNGFAISIQNQVRAWVKETNPKFNTPLSRKQLENLW